MSNTSETSSVSAPTPPKTFFEYIRSFGPGIIVVLTWLGAGDIVEMSIAGGNYGYGLMWAGVIAVVIRFLFVSLIAKYQLCNQHGEGVLDGLARLHSIFPFALMVAAFVMGHVYCGYMTRGIGECCVNLTGVGTIWIWALGWNVVAMFVVFKPEFQRIDVLFKVFLVVLSVSFLGTAIWVGPDVGSVFEGVFAFKLPEKRGDFDPLLVTTGMIGAVGGSLMNLVYPYFLDNKGWNAPEYRRVQTYDLLLAILVMILLNASIWTLGAEVLYPTGLTIEGADDLPPLLTKVLGHWAGILVYVGIFAAIYSSLVGHALGLGYLGSHGFLRWKHGADAKISDYRRHPCYRWIVIWCLGSSLIYTASNMPNFVTLTLLANSAQVILVPMIAGGVWWITADARIIGDKYRNRWWENALLLFLFCLVIWGAYGAIRAIFGLFSFGAS